MTLTLDSNVQYVPRVGPHMASLLEKLGITTVEQFLFYAPFRYNDYAHTVPIRHVRAGTTACIQGEVLEIKNVFTKHGKKLQQAVIRDTTGTMTVIWFNQIYLPTVIHPGDILSLAGTASFFGTKLALISPEYERVKENETTLSTGRIVPVYSETKGLTSKWLRGRIAFLLESFLPTLKDPLPSDITMKRGLMPLRDALQEIHFPTSLPRAGEARKRLAFDELFLMQLQSYIQKRTWEHTAHAQPFQSTPTDTQAFLDMLPFRLTEDQTRAFKHIAQDMERTIPMNRLLEGDVGSGKTVVSAYAMYIAQKNGYQSVLLAPTQILAEQHYQTIQSLLKPFGMNVALVLGGASTKIKDKRLHLPARSDARRADKAEMKDTLSKQKNTEQKTIFIGTHALLQDSISMKNLGLIIIDEQQRFGVRQRALLRKKGDATITPHVLTMTATPIPRTIALTRYGHLDLSTLETMPHGRIPITTWVVPQEKREGAYTWIKKQLKETSCRLFIVCPFIEESETLTTVKAVKKEFVTLQSTVFPEYTLGLLHGNMKATEKTAVLDDFRKGNIQILVTTSVVEVGIDIPEASLILIEAADRFGLSQLHQMRGRVGRGTQKSYCLLFSDTTNPDTLKRLKIMETVTKGPELAEYDLALRGEGDIFGIRQHGIPGLALATLSDRAMVEDVQKAVRELTHDDPDLLSVPLLKEKGERPLTETVQN